MSKGEETRRFIIERSAPIFNQKGIAATAMSDIMEATKLAKGSLYVHFENKDVLAAEVVAYNMELLGKKVFSAIAKAQTAKGKLLAYIEVLTDVLNPPVTGGCPMINFGVEADDTNPLLKRKVHEGMEYSQQVIADIIKQGIKAGEFKPTWNYRDFATIMFALIEGAGIIGRVAGNNVKMKVIVKYLKQMINDQCT